MLKIVSSRGNLVLCVGCVAKDGVGSHGIAPCVVFRAMKGEAVLEKLTEAASTDV